MMEKLSCWLNILTGSAGESYPEEEKQMTLLMEVIRNIRNIRAEMKVPMGKKAEVIIAAEPQLCEQIKEGEAYILSLAQAATISFVEKGFTPDKAAKAMFWVQIFICLWPD